MISECIIYAVPDIKHAWEKLCREIVELSGFNTMFLPYPKSLGKNILEYIMGGRRSIEDVFKEYYGSLYNKIYPRILFIKCLRKNVGKILDLKIRFMYEDVFEKMYNELAEEIAFLSMRNIVRNKIDLEKWVSMIEEILSISMSSTNRNIREILDQDGKCIIVTGMNAVDYYRKLVKRNICVKIKYVLKPYYYRPIDILLRTYSLRNMDEDEIRRLIKEHLKYIREYVIPSKNLEEAYFKWIRDKGYLRYRYYSDTHNC